MIRKALNGVTWLAALLVVAGFFDQIHRSADSIAILRPLFGLVCLIGLVCAVSHLQRLVFAGAALVSAFTVGMHLVPQQAGDDLRIYSKNLGYHNTQMQGIIDDIAAAKVDVVMLQEVTRENAFVLQALQPDFPHQHICRFTGRIGIAVASQRPFGGEPMCSALRAIAAVPIMLDDQPLWLVSAHIPWPWPVDSGPNEQAAWDILSGLNGPVVIAGDFNMVPWAGRVRRIETLIDAKIAGPIRPTLYLRNIPLPIDLVMAPGGGSVTYRPTFGSDHAGIVADLSLVSP